MRLALVVLSLVAQLAGPPVPAARAQTSRRNAGRATPPQGTVKVCRGVSIPDGYTVVAETTSPACPGGAYVIKKDAAPVPAATPAPAAKSVPAKSAPAARSISAAPQPTPVATRPRRAAGEAALDPGGPPAQAAVAKPPTLVRSTTAAPAAVSQPPPAPADSGPLEVGEGDVIRVDTNLVTVPVSVFDRRGNAVTNLRREDFRIFENGVEQEVAYFEPTEKPFTVALVLDTSSSTRFRLRDIKEAATAFARQLQPQDRVLVVTFNDQVLLLTEATNDQRLISDVIDVNARSGDTTRLYDAVHLVIEERLNKIKGRKAIVLFTDGVDTSSFMADYQSTVREAEELDALIYPIQYDTYQDFDAAALGSVTVTTSRRGWPFPGGSRSTTYRLPSGVISRPTREDYEQAGRYLSTLAEKTGGRLYSADDPRQLAQAFSQIAEELRRQYSLGYYPKAPVGANERRQIRVRVRRPDLAVRARDGYVAGARDGAR